MKSEIPTKSEKCRKLVPQEKSSKEQVQMQKTALPKDSLVDRFQKPT